MAASLTIKGLSKSYPAQKDAVPLLVLESMDFHVPAGSIVSIAGLNGSGKTTLLRIIAGLESPDTGSMLIDEKIKTSSSGRNIGMIFQEVALLPWRTVRQNIAVGLELDERPKTELEDLVDDFITAFGLADYAGKYPKELSGGLRQKVAIARTLAPGPGVVLMDEPFSALDCQTREEMLSFLLKVWAKRQDTILFVTHNIEESLYLSDQVLVISPKPSRVAEIIPVTMPRPRDKTSLEFNMLRRRIIDVLRRLSEANP
ncbi:MAG: ABC transporter ATP-binding protein [Desulfovibrio sp.]|jgi:NitT/TauT family transport system ATP-binding protein|nr:ABC transporter ATP-binding protein [Desulfovibrio sp.]